MMRLFFKEKTKTHIIFYIFAIKFKFKRKDMDSLRINDNYSNNKIIFVLDGKQEENLPVPKGLFVTFNGNNNKLVFHMPIKFNDALFFMGGDNNIVTIKNTDYPINDVKNCVADNSEVYIDENASINQGNFYLVANGNYSKSHKVVIGKNFRAARDTIIRSSDGHTLIDPDTNLATNEPEDVIIGDNVWVMSRCMIAKGSYIPSNSAVAAYSFVNKKFNEQNILLAGIPAKILKHNIKWDPRSYGNYMRDMEK